MIEKTLDKHIRNERPEGQFDFPYANSIYYKGILSIVCVLSIFGFMLGLYLINISLTRSREALDDYKKSPDRYKTKSLQRVKTGRKLALAALALWVLEILAFLIFYR